MKKEHNHSQEFIRKRRFFVVLPLLTIPFLTIAFWAMGGGKAKQEVAMTIDPGVNQQVPGAQLADKALDKLGYYDQAESDSVKRSALMKNDPYYQFTPVDNHSLGEATFSQPTDNTLNYRGGAYATSTETKVYDKLQTLNEVLKNADQQPTRTLPDNVQRPNGASVNTADIDRLEQMMRMMQAGTAEADPETEQLNGMLDRILDIQHPERVQQRIKEQKSKGQVFAVKTDLQPAPFTVLSGNRNQLSGNGFFSIDDTQTVTEAIPSIQAVIHEDQTLVSGAVVKLRLTEPIVINGVAIPKDNFIYGEVSLNGERLNAEITSIRYKDVLFPVKLAVYDLDGLPGIYIPGAISRDVAKQSTDRAVQSIGMTTFDPSLTMQAASAGIEFGRNLLSRKVKLVKVHLKAGYRLLLRDEKQKND